MATVSSSAGSGTVSGMVEKRGKALWLTHLCMIIAIAFICFPIYLAFVASPYSRATW